MRRDAAAVAALLCVAARCEGANVGAFRSQGPHNFAPSQRGLAEASYPIVFDESSFPPELLASATYDTVDGLPEGFIWGAATASYQVEGAVSDDGSGISNWHKFSHEPGRVNHNDNGDIADDHYHRFRDDIKLCADMGLTSYRLSLSWSRIMPTGELPLNQKGIDHYNEVIDTIIAHGMMPLVTLFHWDLPMVLEDKYGGWLSPKIQDIYATYAEECFKAFGDRVTHWLSFNEPWSFVRAGYSAGTFPPGRCSDRSTCKEGDSGTETYIAAHNVINAHGKAAEIYADKYAATQKGMVGITLNCDWAEPMTSDPADAAAAERFLEFQLGWFADPVHFGRYPPAMIERVGTRLPTFTAEESARLRKTAPAFFGLNHYSTNFAADRWTALGLKGKELAAARHAEIANNPGSWDSDIGSVFSSVDVNGDPIGPTGDSPWLHVVPWGLRKLLVWVYGRYKTPIIITENGADVPGENGLGLPFVLRDPFRIKYYSGYISQMNVAVKEDKVPVIGYFAWSLLDNFEWADGYSKRFGLVYVDYTTQQRYPKASAGWYSKLVRTHRQGRNDPVGAALLGATNGGAAVTQTAQDASAALPSLLAVVALLAVGGGVGIAAYASRARRPAAVLTIRRGSVTPRALAEGLRGMAGEHSYSPVGDVEGEGDAHDARFL